MPEPLFVSVPPFDTSFGDVAAHVGELVGLPPDVDQRRILDGMFAVGPGDASAFFEVGLVAPRQNIKTSTFEIAALADLFVFRQPLHVWTAHLFDTARASFEHMVSLIENSDDFRRRCRRPRTANGDEAIELLSGESIEFHARSKGGGRGRTGHRVTFDEALFLQETSVGALLPTLATVRGAQVRYGSSAGMVGSDVLRGVRDRGRSGSDPSLAYFEWGAPRVACLSDVCAHGPVGSVVGCALDREDLWAQANPAFGRRISVESLRQLRRAMPPAEFAREFLSWWEDPQVSARVLDADVWAGLSDRGSRPSGAVAFGVSVSPDRSRAVVAAAVWRSDGRVSVELVRVAPTSGWVPDVLARLVVTQDPVAVAVHRSSPAGSLVPSIVARGIEPLLLSSADMVVASGSFYDAVMQDSSVRHLGDPLLMDAVRAASKQGPDSGWMFANRSVEDAPLLAAVLARHALLVSGAARPRPPAPVGGPGVSVRSEGAHMLVSAGF